jgi:hypothetical protein
MKRIISVILFALLSSSIQASEIKLTLHEVRSSNAQNSKTYILFAELPSHYESLYMVYGNSENPLSIESTSAFNHSESNASLNSDSFITINNPVRKEEALMVVGLDLKSFYSGGKIFTNDGAWLVVPNDPNSFPINNKGLIFLGQFNTTGELHGSLNLCGFTSSHQPWKEEGLIFNSAESLENIRHLESDPETISAGDVTTRYLVGLNSNKPDIILYPNPVTQLECQLEIINFGNIGTNVIELTITDIAGIVQKKMSFQATGIEGNKLRFPCDLPNGVYQLTAKLGSKEITQRLIINK